MISFVYFDAGGVAFTDFSGNTKLQELKDDLQITKAKEKKFHAIWEQHAANVCLDFDVDRLVPILKKELDLELSQDYSLLEDFVNRFEANRSIWPFIQETKKKTKIGLLTNMYPRMLPLIRRRNILPAVTWDTIVDSSIVGYQKPDTAIYTFAEKAAGVNKNEILFIDNTPMHIKAAQAFGWQTFLYDSSNQEASSKALQNYFS